MTELWAARLLPASFRGIPFFVDNHEFSSGRNKIGHEPPDRDSTFSEDLGKKSPVYRIEGHVLGDNYFFIRDALLSAMEDGSAGTLIHPYLGFKEVRPGSVSLTEDTKEGRIARFVFEFEDAGDPGFPFAVIDKATKAITGAIATIAAVENAFNVAFTVAGLPAFVASSAISIADDFVTSIRTSISNVRTDFESQANVIDRINEFAENINSLVFAPGELSTEITQTTDLLRGLVPPPPSNQTIDSTSGRDDQVDVFRDLIAFESGFEELPEGTPSERQDKENAKQLQTLIRTSAIASVSRVLIEKTFASNDEAIDARDRTVSAIEVELQNTEDDEQFQALANLKAALVEVLPDPANVTGNVKTDVREIELSSLELTYDLYESTTNERDLIERNKVRNPGFIRGELEVLSVG